MNRRSSDPDLFASTADAFAQMARLTVESQRSWLEYMGRIAAETAARGSTGGPEDPGSGSTAPDHGTGGDPKTGTSEPAAGAEDPASATGSPAQGAMPGVYQDPQRLMAAQLELWSGYQHLFLETTKQLAGNAAEPVIQPAAGDRRFRDPEWDANPFFNFLKQSYLLNARWLRKAVDAIEGLDPETERRLDFFDRQFIDAMAPTNFALTNPEVLRTYVESGGESLAQGMRNLAEDLERGEGRPTLRQVDTEAFEVGENLAITPGKVIYQNELMQLIQYSPSTEQVYRRPLLIVPPWINKFYVLDLRPENSFVKWCVDQGYTTFLISWVNPDASLADKGFEDYMTEGVLEALEAIRQATGERRANVIGYCLGGTLLAATQAWMAAQEDDRIAAGVYFTAQVDFTEAGELLVFTDETIVRTIEEQVRTQGYLDGQTMAWSFNMLRANDLIWSFVINNYLLGKEPPAFDLLYWNSDATRLPAAMWRFYIREMYQRNRLAEPGGVELAGVPIDLRKVSTPVFFQATREDHIAPFRSVYKAMNLFSGPRRFVLAGSGHIAGVVNPPAKNKYQHWVNTRRKQYADADEWLADAEEHPGSWWPLLDAWLAPKSGSKVTAREPGDGALTPIEDAPGSYVRVRS